MSAAEFTHAALVVFALVGVTCALVVFGYAWGRFRSLLALSALCTMCVVGSDVLYFGFDINLIGYCGEPVCDPGPIPATILLAALPFPLFPVAVGVRLRQWQRSRGTAVR